MTAWCVIRVDDNGVETEMARGLSQREADALVEVYTARGHKQLYLSRERADRSMITNAYVRVCRDSGYSMAATDAVQLVSGALGISNWEVWQAMGDLSTMERVARGEHPACQRSI
jgi:hypothetical protein